MNQLVCMRNIKAILGIGLLMTGLLLTGFRGSAQNVNIPNKTGPMGLEVNSYTGNLYFERTDFVIPGSTIEMSVRFSYNSMDFDLNHGYGNGWGFEYDARYHLDSAQNVVILWGDGREDTYTSLGNGNFKAPTGFFSVLKEYEPGKFSVSEKGVHYLFEDNQKKRLTKITGRNNHFIAITRTDSLITSVTNHYGQTISFAYDAKGMLKSVTDAITSPARTWSYSYDTRGNLTEVTDPLGAKNAYSYIINGPMNTVSDKNLNVVDLIYYTDFSIREMIGCNKRMTFSYDTSQMVTVITDHMENGTNLVSKYYYTRIGTASSLAAISSNCCGDDVRIEYDEHGNKINQTDANNNPTKYTYDDAGNVLSTTNALGQTTTYSYHPQHQLLASIKDPKGNVTSAQYDAQGNLISVTHPDGSAYTATYDAFGNMLTSTNPKGKTFTYTYDVFGNLKTVSGPGGLAIALEVSPRGDLLSYTGADDNTRSFEYDILGRMTGITDPLGHKMHFSYDAAGNLFLVKNKNNEQHVFSYDASDRLRQIKNPLQATTEYGYDGMDNLISMTNALGATTAFGFNKQNQLSSITDAEGNVSTFNHDRNGNIITATSPAGRILTYTYDVLNRVKEIRDADGMVGRLTYDAAGNISNYTDAAGATSSMEYDSGNRLRKYTDALNQSSELTYDLTGKIIIIKDKNGKVRSLTYDDLDRIKTITDQNGSVTKIEYGLHGQISSLTDANNNTTTYSYDGLNRLTRSSFPDGKYTENTYDLKNNIVSFRDRDGSVIHFTFDSLNRMTTKTLPDGQVFSYGYDALSRIVTATNNAGTVAFTYDALNRITSESFNGRIVQYAYDLAGRTQKTIYPDLTEVTKTFDTRNRLISIQKNNQPVISYAYNASNQVISKTFANGVTTNLQYDFAGRLTDINTGSHGSMAFTYDKHGNRTSIIRNNNHSEFFTYDDGNRLSTYKRGPAGGPFSVNNHFVYDAVGNRVSAQLDGKSIAYTTNSLNQMLRATDGTTAINYTYDQRGNLSFDGRYHKFYDADRKLLRDSASPAEVIRYEYDAIGRMTKKTINGLTLHFTYAGLNAIEERDLNGITRNRTLFNSFLQPVLNEHFEVPFFYHQNHLYSIEMMTDAGGNLVEEYRYDAFGKQSVYNAAGQPIPAGITGNRYGFTGQLYDSSTRQNQFYFRNYNPETGLFHQQDLIGYGDGMAMYQYVGNNPANGIDIFGLKKRPCDEKERTRSEVVTLQYLDKVLNQLNLLNVTLKKVTGNDLNDRSKKLKWLSTMASVASLTNKINNLVNNWDQMSTKDAQIEIAEIEMALAGLSNDLGLTDKIPVIGKELEAVIGTFGSLDAFVQETTGHSLAYHYAHMSDNAEKLGKDAVQKNEERGEWLQKYIDAVIKAQGTDVEEWTKEAKEWLEVYLRVQKFKKEHTITPPADDCPQNPKPKGRQKKKYRYDGDRNKFVEIIRSNDPNEIIGPDGQPDKRWVSVKDRLPYTVTFENDITASAPAKYVKVIVPVHEKMDAATFQLSNFGFNNQTFEVPVSTSSSYQRLDARDSLGMLIDLVAGYDVITNEFFWEFQAIDPLTLMPTTDPLKGFLLLQDTANEKSRNGHGFVNFSVKPVTNAQTLDSILAFADIVFDQNDTIPTNIEKNVIDALAPTSQLTSLDENYDNSIPLFWSAQDDVHGSGVDYYTLYYSTDGVNFSILKERMTRTDTTFTGPVNQRYFFFVLATDSVGNTEVLRPDAVRNTYLSPGGVVPVSWLYFKGTNQGTSNLLQWATANEVNASHYDVERSPDGQQFRFIGRVQASGNKATNSSYQYTDDHIDRLGIPVMYYRLVQNDLDGRKSYSQVIRLNYATAGASKTMVYPNPTKGLITIVIGDKQLAGTTAMVYDEAGKLLQAVKITSLQQQINLGGYTNGVYFIRLANKEVLKVMKN